MPTPTDDQPPAARSGDRIAKLLARAGIASRREVERMIADGRIALDGVAIDTPATVLDSLRGVTVDGRPVAAPAPTRLFLHHKPAGLLVTERDPAGRPTIYDRLPADLPRVVPVGRLDLATEGLLLLTTDGGLKRELELPANGVERAYRARAYGEVPQAQLEALIEGVEIEGVRYGPIDANLERRTGANVWIELILTEGKNREVRRVLEHLGLQVGRLIRTRYGPFVLGDLPAGGVGEVRQADLAAFRRTLGGRRPAGDERIAVAAREAPVPEPEPTPEPAPPVARAPAIQRPPRAKAGWGTQARPSRPRAAADGQAARNPRERDTADRPFRPDRDLRSRSRTPQRAEGRQQADRPRPGDSPDRPRRDDRDRPRAKDFPSAERTGRTGRTGGHASPGPRGDGEARSDRPRRNGEQRPARDGKGPPRDRSDRAGGQGPARSPREREGAPRERGSGYSPTRHPREGERPPRDRADQRTGARPPTRQPRTGEGPSADRTRPARGGDARRRPDAPASDRSRNPRSGTPGGPRRPDGRPPRSPGPPRGKR